MNNVYFISSNDQHPVMIPKTVQSSAMSHADLVVAYGGDGTVLRAYREMVVENRLDIPLLGINKGTLGFISNDVIEFFGDMYGKLIEMILTSSPDDHIFDNRSLLDIETLDGRRYTALNELTVHPNDIGRLATVDMNINSQNGDGGNVSLKGDGVVVCTPTGSTAYNLSAGGPILMPYMKNLVVTPLNPFTMSGRSIVLGENDSVTLTQYENLRMTVDGQEIEGSPKVMIKFSQDKLILVRTSSFFDAIQNKLGWNRSIK